MTNSAKGESGPNTPQSADAQMDGEAQETERLIAEDRARLTSFVKNLNRGVTIDNMDDELRSWWISRY